MSTDSDSTRVLRLGTTVPRSPKLPLQLETPLSAEHRKCGSLQEGCHGMLSTVRLQCYRME